VVTLHCSNADKVTLLICTNGSNFIKNNPVKLIFFSSQWKLPLQQRECLKTKSALAAALRLTLELPLQTTTAHHAGTRDMAVLMMRKKRKRNTTALVCGTMAAENSLTTSHATTTTIHVVLGISLLR
jgi:hypothetical protein